MDISIKIQYFGVIRLLFNTKEEIIEMDAPLTLENVIYTIDKKYGHSFKKRANHLMIFYYPCNGEDSIQIKFPKDKDLYLKNNSTIKILNALTLG